MSKSNIVTVQWLSSALERPNVKVLDATLYLPAHGKDAGEEFLNARIPGAQRFDFDAVSDTASSLPHMLPSAKHFETALQALGINNDDIIVAYDQHGLFSAARLWWMLKVFGVERAYVLNGGLPAWMDVPQKVDSGPAPTPPGGTFTVRQDRRDAMVMTKDQLVCDKTLWVDVLDARPAGRFAGRTPEPRAGMNSGHIPGAQNMAFDRLVHNGHLLPPYQLQAVFDQIHLPAQPITSCGSGVTAAIISLALAEIGHAMGRLYDGSWAQWGQRTLDLPYQQAVEQSA